MERRELERLSRLLRVGKKALTTTTKEASTLISTLHRNLQRAITTTFEMT